MTFHDKLILAKQSKRNYSFWHRVPSEFSKCSGQKYGIDFLPILNNLDAFSLTAHLLANGRQFIHKMLQTEKDNILTPTSQN